MDQRGYNTLTRDDRGQTLQDYLLGVSFMIVAVVFVVGYLPSVFESYDSPADSVRSEQADRAAEYLVANYTAGDEANVLKYKQPGGIDRTLARDAGMDALRRAASLQTQTDNRAPPNVNIVLVNSTTLETKEDLLPIMVGGDTYSYGDDYEGDAAARATRVVQLRGDSTQCTPTCWLVVRVWG